jgi:conjugal transfer mating pair stabilization protein TraG
VTSGSKVNIMIEDPISPSFSPQAVSDVPAIIGLPVTFISNIGLRLTEAIENAYIAPSSGGGSTNFHDSSAVSKTGRFNLYGQMMKDSLEVAITNPYLKASMRSYVADCAVPLLYKGILNVNDVLTNPDIWEALKTTQTTLLTTYQSQSETTDPITGNLTHEMLTDCPTAWSSIKSDMQAEGPNIVAALGAKNGYQTSYTNTEASSFMGIALADAINTTSNGLITNSAADWVQRTAAINTFADIGDTVLSGDTGGLSQAMSLQQAKAAQKSGWMMAADIFQATMGYVYTVLQTFIIAISPILLLMAVIPGIGMKALDRKSVV